MGNSLLTEGISHFLLDLLFVASLDEKEKAKMFAYTNKGELKVGDRVVLELHKLGVKREDSLITIMQVSEVKKVNDSPLNSNLDEIEF